MMSNVERKKELTLQGLIDLTDQISALFDERDYESMLTMIPIQKNINRIEPDGNKEENYIAAKRFEKINLHLIFFRSYALFMLLRYEEAALEIDSSDNLIEASMSTELASVCYSLLALSSQIDFARGLFEESIDTAYKLIEILRSSTDTQTGNDEKLIKGNELDAYNALIASLLSFDKKDQAKEEMNNIIEHVEGTYEQMCAFNNLAGECGITSGNNPIATLHFPNVKKSKMRGNLRVIDGAIPMVDPQGTATPSA